MKPHFDRAAVLVALSVAAVSLVAVSLFAVSLASTLPAAAKRETVISAPSKDALIRQIAESTAWSELCVNASVDPAAVARFRRREHIAVDGHYRVVYGFAYASNHDRAMRNGGDFPASCLHALARYGAGGQNIPGLVRPLWHGSVPGQMIDTDGPGFIFFPFTRVK